MIIIPSGFPSAPTTPFPGCSHLHLSVPGVCFRQSNSIHLQVRTSFQVIDFVGLGVSWWTERIFLVISQNPLASGESLHERKSVPAEGLLHALKVSSLSLHAGNVSLSPLYRWEKKKRHRIQLLWPRSESKKEMEVRSWNSEYLTLTPILFPLGRPIFLSELE